MAAYLVVGFALLGAQLLTADGVPQAMSHAAVNIFVATGVFGGVILHRPRRPTAWYSLAVAFALFAVSNLGWAFAWAGSGAWAQGVDVGAKMLAVVAIGYAVWHFLLDGRLSCSFHELLDGALVVVGSVLLLAQVALLADRTTMTSGSGQTISSTGLLILSAALVLVALRLLLRSRAGRRNASMIMLAVASALVLLGQALVVLAAPAAAPRWVDAAWLLGALLNGVAALHPAMSGDEVPIPRVPAHRLTATRSVVISVLLLTGPVLLWLALVGTDNDHLVTTAQLVTLGAVTLLGVSVAGDRDDSSAAVVGLRRVSAPDGGRAFSGDRDKYRPD